MCDLIYNLILNMLQKNSKKTKKKAKGASGVEEFRICHLRPKVVLPCVVHMRGQRMAKGGATTGVGGGRTVDLASKIYTTTTKKNNKKKKKKKKKPKS